MRTRKRKANGQAENNTISDLENMNDDEQKEDMDDQNESGGEEEESNNMDNIEHIDESMKSGTIIKDGHEKFAMLTSMTSEASSRLCEQLRLILEPTLATKLKDYRTGKRINMRKIIPYIASSLKKIKYGLDVKSQVSVNIKFCW